jgi:hypothetical protein
VSGVECGRDGAALDPHDLCDRLVVEVGVVAQEEHEPLSLWEPCNHGSYFEPVAGMAVRIGLVALVQRDDRMSLLHAADVHDDPPEPGVEALCLPQIASVSQSVGERLLHCVARTVDISEHPEREREKSRRRGRRPKSCSQLVLIHEMPRTFSETFSKTVIPRCVLVRQGTFPHTRALRRPPPSTNWLSFSQALAARPVCELILV